MTCSLTNTPFSKEAKFRTKNKINSTYKSIYLDIDIYLDEDLHMYVCVLSHLVMSHSAIPWTVAPPAPLSMDSPGKNTGVGCRALLRGILSTQESNPGLPHCRWILYRLSHQGSPYIYINPYICKSINRYISISRYMDTIKFKSIQFCYISLRRDVYANGRTTKKTRK